MPVGLPTENQEKFAESLRKREAITLEEADQGDHLFQGTGQ